MKIAIDPGHNVKGDRGALGINHTEDRLITDLASELMQILQRAGHEVVNCLPKSANSVINSLSQRVAIANAHKCDLFVSLHFNAFNHLAFGSEVYAASSDGQEVASRVLKEICKLGFYDRGVKNRNFYVIKHTQMPAILVECCFCDSYRDMKDYNYLDMAKAIANGIMGKESQYVSQAKNAYLKIDNPYTWIKSSTEQVASLSVSEVTKIKSGLYSLLDYNPMEESHYWVKLKSGLEGFVFYGHANIVWQ